MIAVDGLKELLATVRAAKDGALRREMGQANKGIGELVVSKLQPRPDPAAVGAGKGAAVRPSASVRDVILRVGGAHRRNPPQALWGARAVSSRRRARPLRPYIKQTAADHMDEISDAWLHAIAKGLSSAFYRTDVE